MDRWSGKTAIVTGASAGIGRAIAETLALSGMKVLAVARREERLKELAQKVKGHCKGSGQIIPYATDITKEENTVKLVRFAEESLNGVHVLINNAGTAYNTKVTECELDKWRCMYDLNVFAPGIAIREFLASMKRRGIKEGHIINISSISGHGIPNVIGKNVYNSTKHALRLLTEGVRAELTAEKSAVKISMVSPGFVDTEIIGISGFIQPGPGFPMLKSEDIALACVHILSTPPHMLVADYIVRPMLEDCPA